MPETDPTLELRVSNLEIKLEQELRSLSDKVDSILKHLSNRDADSVATSKDIEYLSKELGEVRNKTDKNTNDLVAVQVSLAEKLGYGALGGGLSSLLLLGLQYIMGA